MCGISVIVNPARPGALDRARDSAAVLKDRGPDGSNSWQSASQQVTLTHTRLSTVDLVNGSQPIVSEDGTVAAVVNGEFYDPHIIRSRLIALGHRFSSNSDSEILIHLYEHFGTECLDELHGVDMDQWLLQP